MVVLLNLEHSINNEIAEKEYAQWERDIINDALDIKPTDGHPTVVVKDKVVVVVDLMSNTTGEYCSTLVEHNKDTHSKIKLQMHHIGDENPGWVSSGKDGDQFKHPSCDFGGLTNVWQTPGESLKFLGKNPLIVLTDEYDQQIQPDLMVDEWKYYQGKSILEGEDKIREHFLTFIKSVIDILRNPAIPFTKACLRFHRLNPELRILYTWNDIYRRTNKYLIKNFGKDEKYGPTKKFENGCWLNWGIERGDTPKLHNHTYLSVSQKPGPKNFITSNLNPNNLNEYRSPFSIQTEDAYDGRDFTEKVSNY